MDSTPNWLLRRRKQLGLMEDDQRTQVDTPQWILNRRKKVGLLDDAEIQTGQRQYEEERKKREKREKIEAENKVYAAEAEKANNTWQMKLSRGVDVAKTIGKSMVESPTKLGTYLGQAGTAVFSSDDQKVRDEGLNKLNEQSRKYKEKYQKGDLREGSYKKIRNILDQEYKRLGVEAKEYEENLPSTKQIVKAGAGTALDVATAGQFSRAKAGLQAGKLARGAKVAQTAEKATRGAKALRVASEIGTGSMIGGAYNALNELDEDQMTAKGAGQKYLEGAATGALFTGALKGAGKVARETGDTLKGLRAIKNKKTQDKIASLLGIAEDATMPKGGAKTLRNAKIASLLDETSKVTSQAERNETVKNLLALKTDVQKHLDEYNGMLSDFSLKSEKKNILKEIKNTESSLKNIDNEISKAQKALPVKESPQVISVPSKGSVEQIIESSEGFKPGVKEQFDNIASMNVAPEPILGKSKVFERVKNKLGEEFKDDVVTYQKISLEEDAQKAVDLMNTDRQKAMRIAKGLQKAPENQTETAISIALAEDAAEKGDWKLYRDLVEKRSLRQTRRGQEIVSEKGSIHQDADYYMKKVLNERIQKVGKTGVSLTGKETPSAKLTATVEREAKKASEVLSTSRLKIEDAQKLLDDLTCK